MVMKTVVLSLLCSCWMCCYRFVCVCGFRLLVGSLRKMRLGWWISFIVMFSCCCCLLDSVLVWCFYMLVRSSCSSSVLLRRRAFVAFILYSWFWLMSFLFTRAIGFVQLFWVM